MNIWVQLYELGVYLIAGVFVGVAVGAFFWFKYLRTGTTRTICQGSRILDLQ